MTRGNVITAAASMCLVIAGCGISNDSSPRDIPPSQQVNLGANPDVGGSKARGTARIYLLGPVSAGQATVLLPVARDVPEQPGAVLQALLAGPNSDEIRQQLRTALPGGLRLISSRIQGTALRLDVSKEMLELSGSDLVDGLAQIVFTAAEIQTVQSVKILVDGVEQRWPAGNGELQAAALTIYDYPGKVLSAQPPYPAVPTPRQP